MTKKRPFCHVGTNLRTRLSRPAAAVPDGAALRGSAALAAPPRARPQPAVTLLRCRWMRRKGPRPLSAISSFCIPQQDQARHGVTLSRFLPKRGPSGQKSEVGSRRPWQESGVGHGASGRNRGKMNAEPVPCSSTPNPSLFIQLPDRLATSSEAWDRERGRRSSSPSRSCRTNDRTCSRSGGNGPQAKTPCACGSKCCRS